MAYTKNTWADGSTGGTPITAAKLNAMETGIAAGADGSVVDSRLSVNVPLITKSSSTRPTSDATRTVIWVGATQPTGMLDGDVWIQA